ncbi:MAG: hypothetical protein AB1757_13425 [Acidobacteriota bacterium]
MIRRVAFGKAILAGVAGALVWELTVRILIALRLPLLDIVYVLGTMMFGQSPTWLWWPVGMALHAMVGAIWAVFYAYFFWSTFDWPPVMQGVVFSLGSAILAGLVMIPQMGLMHPLMLRGEMPTPGKFGLMLAVMNG